MSEAFKVPADLADSNLNLCDVRAIVEMRRQRRALANRIAALPEKHKALTAELRALEQSENTLRSENEPIDTGDL